MHLEPTQGPIPDDDVVEVDGMGDLDDVDDDDGLAFNKTAGVPMVDEYDVINGGHGMVVSRQNKSAGERKMKREHGIITHFEGDASSWDSPDVPFKVKVQHHVSAYITWPEKLSPCDYSTKVIGYVLRYYQKENGESLDEVEDDVEEEDGAFYGSSMDYTMQNLSDNFVVLDGLRPDSTYGYQVKYVLVSGPDSDWSMEAELSTYYIPPT